MNAHSLIASAGINFGLALLILSLFSIFKKQPSNSYIYYARPLSENQQFHVAAPGFNLRRFLPSVSWIPAAFRVTDDEILEATGLDALVIIRLFKFGIKFFVACSLVGVFVLVPVNFYDRDEMSGGNYTMDSFTISNVTRGSNRLWVHFTCLWLVSVYALYLMYKEYAMILGRRIQLLQDLRNRPDQFTIIIREIPLCSQHKSYGCHVDHFFTKHYPESYHSYQMVYDDKDLNYLLNQAASISQEVDILREKLNRGKQDQGSSLLGTQHRYDGEVNSKIEKLQELRQKIGEMQQYETLQQKELPVAFVTFKSRRGATLASQSQQHPHPLLWISEKAPEPRDVRWRSLEIPYRLLPLNAIGVILLASLITIFFAIPVTAVQGIAKFEKLKKWFPPAMAIQLIPGLRSVVTGYLPSAILNGFIYIIPFAMLGMAHLAGFISNSKAEIKTCNMVFYFLVGNVFFLSLLSGSLLDEIGESVAHPKDIPNHLARAVSNQADFFITYILTDGLSGFSLEILQPGLLCWVFLKYHTYGRRKKKTPYVFSLPYFRVLPVVCLSMLIGMIYAVVAPLLLPFLIGYFFLGYCVYINQIHDAYVTVYETCGLYWPYVHQYIMTGIVLMQITMIGMFGLKSKPAASISTIPLLVLTIIFNGYCKMRFYPSFKNSSVQTATKNDELDKKAGMTEYNPENAIDAYRPPFLQPVKFKTAESSYTEPLLSS